MKKNNLLLLILFIVATFFVACSDVEKQSNELVTKGISEFEAGNMEEALKLYNQAIELWEDNWSAYNSRSLVNVELDKMEEALLDLNEAAKIEGFNEKTVFEARADLKYKMQDYSGSLVDFNKLIVMDNANSYFYLKRGNCFLEMGNLDKAFADYSKTIELDSANYMAYYQKGKIRMKKQDVNLAMDDYDKALEIQEDDEIYLFRAMGHKKRNDYRKSISDLDKAIKLNPKNAEAYYQRALVKELSNIDYGQYNLCKDLREANLLGHNTAKEQFELLCERKYKFEDEVK